MAPPATIRVDATDAGGDVEAVERAVVVDTEGLRHLRRLAVQLRAGGDRPVPGRAAGTQTGEAGR